MPRRPHPWYRAARKAWYFTTPDGKQVSTGITDPNDEAGAVAARLRLLAECERTSGANNRAVAILDHPTVRAGLLKLVEFLLAAQEVNEEPAINYTPSTYS
jgi:hypothetical protein